MSTPSIAKGTVFPPDAAASPTASSPASDKSAILKGWNNLREFATKNPESKSIGLDSEHRVVSLAESPEKRMSGSAQGGTQTDSSKGKLAPELLRALRSMKVAAGDILSTGSVGEVEGQAMEEPAVASPETHFRAAQVATKLVRPPAAFVRSDLPQPVYAKNAQPKIGELKSSHLNTDLSSKEVLELNQKLSKGLERLSEELEISEPKEMPPTPLASADTGPSATKSGSKKKEKESGSKKGFFGGLFGKGKKGAKSTEGTKGKTKIGVSKGGDESKSTFYTGKISANHDTHQSGELTDGRGASKLKTGSPSENEPDYSLVGESLRRASESDSVKYLEVTDAADPSSGQRQNASSDEVGDVNTSKGRSYPAGRARRAFEETFSNPDNQAFVDSSDEEVYEPVEVPAKRSGGPGTVRHPPETRKTAADEVVYDHPTIPPRAADQEPVYDTLETPPETETGSVGEPDEMYEMPDPTLQRGDSGSSQVKIPSWMDSTSQDQDRGPLPALPPEAEGPLPALPPRAFKPAPSSPPPPPPQSETPVQASPPPPPPPPPPPSLPQSEEERRAFATSGQKRHSAPESLKEISKSSVFTRFPPRPLRQDAAHPSSGKKFRGIEQVKRDLDERVGGNAMNDMMKELKQRQGEMLAKKQAPADEVSPRVGSPSSEGQGKEFAPVVSGPRKEVKLNPPPIAKKTQLGLAFARQRAASVSNQPPPIPSTPRPSLNKTALRPPVDKDSAPVKEETADETPPPLPSKTSSAGKKAPGTGRGNPPPPPARTTPPPPPPRARSTPPPPPARTTSAGEQADAAPPRPPLPSGFTEPDLPPVPPRAGGGN